MPYPSLPVRKNWSSKIVFIICCLVEVLVAFKATSMRFLYLVVLFVALQKSLVALKAAKLRYFIHVVLCVALMLLHKVLLPPCCACVVRTKSFVVSGQQKLEIAV